MSEEVDALRKKVVAETAEKVRILKLTSASARPLRYLYSVVNYTTTFMPIAFLQEELCRQAQAAIGEWQSSFERLQKDVVDSNKNLDQQRTEIESLKDEYAFCVVKWITYGMRGKMEVTVW